MNLIHDPDGRDGGLAFPMAFTWTATSDCVGLSGLPMKAGDMEHIVRTGMTLRDYFMAHAPAEPQPWFQPVMPPEPTAPSKEHFTDKDRDDWRSERVDWAPEECSQAVRDHAAAVKAWRKAQHEWNRLAARERYVQWPRAWAQAMLAERAKP